MEQASNILQSSFIQSLMQKSLPLTGDKELQKLDWLLSINDELFRQQLRDVVSVFITFQHI